MDAKASSQNLLYVSSQAGTIFVYSYPKRKYVGTFRTPSSYPAGECIDSAGDVFITTTDQTGSATVYEYAHGGTTPIAALSDPGEATGCAVDPTTGNLAVANWSDDNNPYRKGGPSLAIYAAAQGYATMYYPNSGEIGGFYFCGYDNKGNLYLTAFPEYGGYELLVRFEGGSASFGVINLDRKIYGGSSVQWDGKHMAVSSAADARGRGPLSVYRLSISGSGATVIRAAQLESEKEKYTGQLWIQGNTVIGIELDKGYGNVLFWPYPSGGEPRRDLTKVGAELWGVTVSTAPR